MLIYKDFCKEIERDLSEYYGNTKTIEAHQVRKNNGVLLDSIVIRDSQTSISPTIYLNEFYKDYQRGKSLGDIVLSLIKIYEKNKISAEINFDFFKNYENIKENVFQKAINYEKNKEALSKIPHIRFLDLAIVCYYSYVNDYFGSGSIQIENSHLQLWNIDKETLLEDAKRNTQSKLGLELKNMNELMGELLSENQDEISALNNAITSQMYVMTLKGRMYGAACIFYSDYLGHFADKIGKSYYILPSSIHELILVMHDGTDQSQKLKSMVKEVNETQVEEQEQLSDHVYFFDKDRRQLSLIL